MSADWPILIVPYMWIGDFVRGHTVVRLLRQRFPDRPIDLLTTTMVAPLIDYMPGVRKGIVVDLPRKRLALGQHRHVGGEEVLRPPQGEGRRAGTFAAAAYFSIFLSSLLLAASGLFGALTPSPFTRFMS